MAKQMPGKLLFDEDGEIPFSEFDPGEFPALHHAWIHDGRSLLTRAFRQLAVEGHWAVFEGKPYWAPSDETGSYWGDQFPVDLEITPLEFANAFESLLSDPDTWDHLHAWKAIIDDLLSRCTTPSEP